MQPAYRFLTVLALLTACAEGTPNSPNSDTENPADGNDDETFAEEAGVRLDGGQAAPLDAAVRVVDASAAHARSPDASPPDAATAVASPDAASAPRKPRCVQKESQVIILGDSYFNWISHTFPDDIKRVTGQSWRMEAQPGFSMATGGWGSIPQTYYDSIKRDPDAHTVLMTGGGNDILLPDPTRASLYECTNKGADAKQNCKDIVAEAVKKARSVMVEMADAGIRDIVYSFYPHVPASTIATGDGPSDILDYALPLVRAACADAITTTKGRTRCTFVDLVPYFEGHADWFNPDIHPSSLGSGKMAELYWKVMSDACLGQKGPKACCEP